MDETNQTGFNKPVLEISDVCAREYMAFADTMLINPTSVLYPCCGRDITPAKVFDNITFVDLDKTAIDDLQKAGYSAFHMDIVDYVPEQRHDMLILQNPGFNPETGEPFDPEQATKHITRGAYIVANDYHRTAARLAGMPDKYMLMCGLDTTDGTDDGEAVCRKHLLGFFEPVADGEELKRLRPSEYEFIMKNYPHQMEFAGVEHGDSFTDIYTAYKKMMNEPAELPFKNVAHSYAFMKL